MPFSRLIASSAMPEAVLLRASLLATFTSALRQWFSQSRAHRLLAGTKDLAHARLAPLGDMIRGVSTKHPTPQQLHALSAGNGCEVSPRQSKCVRPARFGGTGSSTLLTPTCRIMRRRRSLT
eukprot:1730844-Pleurochrysis_carterae.AAC.2